MMLSGYPRAHEIAMKILEPRHMALMNAQLLRKGRCFSVPASFQCSRYRSR